MQLRDGISKGGGNKVIVAILDSGIDYNHEDLNSSFSGGFDFIHHDELPFDDHGQGTHLAGIIGAAGKNGIGISGVAQKVSLMPLKVFSAEGIGTTADAIRAIHFAIQKGARILNLSWGGSIHQENWFLKEFISAARAKGVLFVMAAGESELGADIDSRYPALFSLDHLILVAATDRNDELWRASNFGKSVVQLAAPGTDILSTLPWNGYATLSGTAVAAAYVSGAIALIWAEHSDWSYRQVKSVLLNGSDSLPSLVGKVASARRLNVLKSLQMKDSEVNKSKFLRNSVGTRLTASNPSTILSQAIQLADETYQKAVKQAGQVHTLAIKTANDLYQKKVKEIRDAYVNAVNKANAIYIKEVQGANVSHDNDALKAAQKKHSDALREGH